MALREPFSTETYRTGSGTEEGVSFRGFRGTWDVDDAPPREWIPSRPARKLPAAHSGSLGGPLGQEDTARFLEGETLEVTSRMGQTRARWDPDANELQIWFGDKGFGYSPVMWYEAQDYICARSKGTWWWDHIGTRGKGGKGKLKKSSRVL